jgi:hypothetical protein
VVEIKLSKGYTALVDDEDANLAEKKWSALEVLRKDGSLYTVYAVRLEAQGDGKRRLTYLHRKVLGITDPKVVVDHRDGDGRNNRRANLRPCTNGENVRSRHRFNLNNTSGYRGVKKIGESRWSACIKFNRKRIHLGCFDSPEDASNAYKNAASTYFGEFANGGLR